MQEDIYYCPPHCIMKILQAMLSESNQEGWLRLRSVR